MGFISDTGLAARLPAGRQGTSEMWRIGEGSMPAILIMPPSSLKYGHLNINEASTWQ